MHAARARARAVLQYMHVKSMTTRIPSSFMCDSTNKLDLGRSGTGYLTQNVPALRDRLDPSFRSTAVHSTVAVLHLAHPVDATKAFRSYIPN